MECVGFWGGVSFDFVDRLANNLIEYAQRNQRYNGKFGGGIRKNVSAEEIFHFLGIILKIFFNSQGR